MLKYLNNCLLLVIEIIPTYRHFLKFSDCAKRYAAPTHSKCSGARATFAQANLRSYVTAHRRPTPYNIT